MALRAARAGWLADELDRRAGRFPPVVTVHVPANVGGPARFRMATRDGADQIARDVWRAGWAAYERPLPDAFAMWARQCTNAILDVGANTGFYALLAASVAPHAAVHAFEPYPPIIPMLRENLALNRLATPVRVFEQAVGAEPGKADLHIPDPGHGLVETSASLDPGERAVGEVIPVEVTSVDAHAKAHALRVDLMKIDVETLDHLVVAGAADTLDRDRPVVFFELLPHVSAAPLEALRAVHGYRTAALKPDGSLLRSPAVQHDPATWNHVLVPDELADRFYATLAPALVIRGE